MELKKLCVAVSVSGALALSGCFSGGSSGGSETSDPSDPSDPPDPQLTGVTTGIFVDSAVGGLEYSTSSGIEGVTDEDGTFEYQEGDTVTFRIGQIEIGRVTADGVITPVEVAGADSEEDVYVANIAQLLQSLDDGGFVGTGIDITESTRDEAAGLNGDELDPATADGETFEEDLNREIGELTAGNRSPRTEPVDRAKAINHLRNTVNSLNRITSCSDDGAGAVEDDDLPGKAFVSILTDSDPMGESRIAFEGDGTFNEISNDNSGRVTNTSTGDWDIVGGNQLALNRPAEDNEHLDEDDNEMLDVCISDRDDSLLIGFEEEDAFSRLAPQGSITNGGEVAGNYTLTIEGERIGRLTVTEDGDALEASLRTDESTEGGSVAINDGNLTLSDIDGRPDATAYWLDGAINQSAVYVEGQGDSRVLGKIEALGPVTPATDATFASRTVFTRDAENIITILWFDSPNEGQFVEFANDINEGEEAKRRPGSWTFEEDELNLDFDDGENPNFEIEEDSGRLYARESDDEPGVGEFFFHKAARVSEAGMIGEYTVTIPSENTSERSLKLGRDGECLLEGEIGCSWEVAAGQRRIDIELTDFPEVPVYVWNMLGREGEFAYLQLDDGPPEPGVMRKQ